MGFEIWISDCVRGKAVQVTKTPLLLGSHPSCDFAVEGSESVSVAVRLDLGMSGARIERGRDFVGSVFLNGRRLDDNASKAKLDLSRNHALQVDASLFMIRVVDSKRVVADGFLLWRSHLREPWVINRMEENWDPTQQFTIQQIAWLVAQKQIGFSDWCYPGRSNVGFPALQLEAILSWVDPEPPPASLPPLPLPHSFPASTESGAGGWETGLAPDPVTDVMLSPVNSEHGEFTCPVCWLKFDRGDVMHIAVHDELRGDMIMGEDAMLRFHATRFNDRGQALDPKGVPCMDVACPHCRRALPHGYMDVPVHIFSIVGAPSSGKSYYLSTLVRGLQVSLHRNFGLAFRDFHPEGNRRLNAMKNSLFGASTPQDAWLNKTDLEGDMYERLPRYGQVVALPKPFSFAIVPEGNRLQNRAIVFYDNAGEHFEPGRDSASSPGAQHLASSAGIFFLFDPTSNVDFRRRLHSSGDPQMQISTIDQQDVILAETEIRVKRLLGLRRDERIEVPLAMMIGKCDVWLEDLGPDRLRPAIANGAVDLGAIRHNSDVVRAYLIEVCPYLVSVADSIAHEVAYFPVSSLGHTPVKFSHPTQGEKIGPDPTQMNPMFVEVPTLWVLSKVAPDLIPSFC